MQDIMLYSRTQKDLVSASPIPNVKGFQKDFGKRQYKGCKHYFASAAAVTRHGKGNGWAAQRKIMTNYSEGTKYGTDSKFIFEDPKQPFLTLRFFESIVLPWGFKHCGVIILYVVALSQSLFIGTFSLSNCSVAFCSRFIPYLFIKDRPRKGYAKFRILMPFEFESGRLRGDFREFYSKNIGQCSRGHWIEI